MVQLMMEICCTSFISVSVACRGKLYRVHKQYCSQTIYINYYVQFNHFIKIRFRFVYVEPEGPCLLVLNKEFTPKHLEECKLSDFTVGINSN